LQCWSGEDRSLTCQGSGQELLLFISGTFICVDLDHEEYRLQQEHRCGYFSHSLPAKEGQVGHYMWCIFSNLTMEYFRRYMVQTRAQYEYVYKCVEAYLAIKEKKMSTSVSSLSICPA
jgi:protein tyrosine phosphatase